MVFFVQTESIGNVLLQIGVEEHYHLVPGDDIHPVVQIHMAGVGNNHQFLIVSREFFEGIFAEIAGMGLFTVDNQHCGTNLAAVSEDGLVHE